MNKLDHYYAFRQSDENEQIYDISNLTIFGEEVIYPYLIVTLGFYDGFTIYYAANSIKEDEYKLMEKGEYFIDINNICNKALEIFIDEQKTYMEKEKYDFETRKKREKFY